MPPANRDEIAYSEMGRRAVPPIIARLMNMALAQPGLLSLAAGFTDTSGLPSETVGRAVSTLLSRPGLPEYLQYGSNAGRPELRRLIADRLQEFESLATLGDLAGKMIISNGSQQVLYLAAQTLCDPGDIVLVDQPSYFVFLEMLAGLGIRAHPLPMDEEGRLDVPSLEGQLDAFAAAGEIGRVKAVYFVSYYSNPTGRCLAEGDKVRLAETLAARDLLLPVLEDAAYRELYFSEAFPSRSVLSLEAYERFPRLYCATTTKTFASGLKVGYALCTDEAWREKILAVKGHHDFGTANFNQAILEQVLGEGSYQEHLSRARAIYYRKMRALHDTLIEEKLDEAGWSWSAPEGGLYLWLRAPEGVDTGAESEFCRSCLDHGVLYVPGGLCFSSPEGERPPGGEVSSADHSHVRLSYGVLDLASLREAGRRFCSAARSLSGGAASQSRVGI